MAISEKDLSEAGFSKPKVGNVHIDARHPESHWVNNIISCHKKRDSRSGVYFRETRNARPFLFLNMPLKA
ncbi:hypothetical protein OQ483_24660 (plasmid) [Enterobacter bugandensis]|uniref:hypothetical protein n=1 Tax=Enterobacter bugandensis TaxID=881260 RepID=UPI00283AA393|nr:hypothetical protein [Enterobacter bugandensis]WMU75299.1 hypothetical protein OQ483_24660 [Enterobacter bugandensis]